MEKFSKFLEVIGGIFVVAAVALVAGNVVVRLITGHSFNGSYELTGLFATMFVAVSIPVATLRGTHIFVELLTSHLHGAARMITEYIARFFDLVLAVLYSYTGFDLAMQKFAASESTDTLSVPIWPFRFLWVICSILMILFTIYNIVRIPKRLQSEGSSLDAEISEAIEEATNAGKEDGV